MFVSSHILSEVQQLADVVGIIAHGRLVREGSVETLLREEGSVRIRVAPAEVPTAAGLLEPVAGAGTVTPGGRPGGRLAERQDRPGAVGRAEPGAGRVPGIFASRIEGGANLESLFLELTGVASRRRGTARATRRPDAGPPPTVWANDPGAKPEPTGWTS